MAEAMALLMPTPQVAAIRAIAIEGAWGPWSTAAPRAMPRSVAWRSVGSSPRNILISPETFAPLFRYMA